MLIQVIRMSSKLTCMVVAAVTVFCAHAQGRGTRSNNGLWYTTALCYRGKDCEEAEIWAKMWEGAEA